MEIAIPALKENFLYGVGIENFVPLTLKKVTQFLVLISANLKSACSEVPNVIPENSLNLVSSAGKNLNLSSRWKSADFSLKTPASSFKNSR